MKNERVSLQRRPFLTPIWVSGLAVMVGLSFALFVVWVWGTADTTTVIVVLDAPAASAGETRADVLARLMSGSGVGRIDAIYLPQSGDSPTGRLLAARLGLIPQSVADYPKKVARIALRKHGGGRVLTLGDAQTTRQIIEELTGLDGVVAANDAASSVLFVVTVPRIGHANILRLNY